jgi:2'-5' RNA ligase
VSHAIVTFPDTPHIERIEHVRRLFDPLARVIPSHVTLVFPFGPLARYLSETHVFRPHITLGRHREPEALATALAKAREWLPASSAVVRELTIVRLDGSAVAERESTIGLSSEPQA